MSVLIYIDSTDGYVKKSSLEALTYGSTLAMQLGVSAEAVILGNSNDDLAALGKYCVKKIYHANNDLLNHVDAQVFTNEYQKQLPHVVQP